MKILLAFTVIHEQGEEIFPSKKQDLLKCLEEIQMKPITIKESVLKSKAIADIIYLAEVPAEDQYREEADRIEHSIEPILNPLNIFIHHRKPVDSI